MNTTAAAQQAKVTIRTIRVWCRTRVLTATKQAGRWIIDPASLTRRTQIAAWRTSRRSKPAPKVVYSVETMTGIGGSRWTRGDKDRVYINDWAALAGLETSRYNTGNISSAAYRGEQIANGQAHKALGAIDKVWYDTADGKLHCRFGYSEPRFATRDEIWHDVITGVRAAIAAL